MTDERSRRRHAAAHDWLSPADLAAELGVPIGTVYRWTAAGHAGGHCPRFARLGKHIRFRRDWVDAWTEERADAAA